MECEVRRRSTHDVESLTFIIVFAALVAIFVLWLGWRISFPLEIDGNEAFNAWHADNAFSPNKLYPNPDVLILNNYPPLSFIVVRLISSIFANEIVAGRILSLLSIFLVGAATYRCARELGAAPKYAALGGLWFIATMARGFAGYAGMDDPNLLGLSVAAWAFYVYLSARSASTIFAAFFLMAVAGFIKHNLIAIPICAIACVLISQRRMAMPIMIFGLLTCATFSALTVSVYGSNFVLQLLAARQVSLLAPLKSLDHLQWVVVVWPFWIVWLRWSPDRRAKIVTTILIVAGTATWFLWKVGAGVDENVQFELVFGTSICVAVVLPVLHDRGISTSRGWITLSAVFCLVLIARLLVSPECGPYLLLGSPAYRLMIARQSLVVDREVSRIRTIPGAVSCSIQTVCYLAGKAFVFNDFAVQQQIAMGRASNSEIAAAVRNIRFETIDPRAHW